MAISIEQLGKAAVASGILTADELKSVWTQLSAADRPKDGETFANLLVRQGKLTEFQSHELLSGSGTPLVLGDYVLLSKIGAGGMGQVFKAHHRRMKRLAAIKLLPAALTKDEAAVKRFEREVEAAAKLTHTNIVQTFDAGVQRGVWYLVMEYVDGQDLSAIVKQRGPMSVPDAVDCILQAARGLAFAHSEGVVHRDIKPANLLLDKKGVVKILDMGLARIESSGPADHQLTNTGTVMGTVDYMAPEQAMNTRLADARSDMYSLGCSLYRILVGESIYGGETAVEKIMQHMNAPVPPLSAKRPDVPDEIDRIYQKLVAKKPEDRYQQTLQLVAELEAWRSPGTVSSLANSSTSLTSFAVGSSTKTERPSGGTLAGDSATEQFGRQKQKGIDLTFSGVHPEIQTDPKSEINIHQAATAARGSGRKSPPIKLLAVAAGGFLLMLLGVWVILRDKNGQEVARVKVPEGGTATVTSTPLPPREIGRRPGEGGPETSTTSSNATLPHPPSTPTITPVKSTPPAPSMTPPAAQSVTSPQPPSASGSPIDLIAKFDPDRDAVKGTWTKAGTSIVGGGVLKLFTPQTVPEEYDLDAELELLKRHQKGIGLGFLTNGQQPTLVMDIDSVWVISDVDGLSNSRPNNPTRVENTPWPVGERVRIKLSVRRDGVRVLLGDKPIIDWHGTAAQLSANSYFTNNAPNSFFVNCGSLTVHKLTLTPLISAPPPLAVAPFDAAQAKAHQAAWAKHLGTEVETTNSISMKMVLIPPGEFLMGSTDEQVEAALKVAEENNVDQSTKDCIRTERPQHRVVITKSVLMGATEVTVGQFKQFALSTNFQTEAEKAPTNTKGIYYLNPGYSVTDDSPAVFIGWNDAVACCNWLSVKENLEPCYQLVGKTWATIPNKNGYRLPTEAEWEYACRAGTTTQYSFGDDYAELVNFSWFKQSAAGKSHPVGMLRPNPFGLYDMHGYLQEWCGDYWDTKSYENHSLNDPHGPEVGNNRVLRGGNYTSNSFQCRSAHRTRTTTGYSSFPNGFRIVRELSAPSTTASVTPQPAVPAEPITDFNSPEFQTWVKEVQAMSAEEQVQAVSKKLMELNPGFDGKLMGYDGKGSPILLQFSSQNVTDLTPLRALASLQLLECGGDLGKRGRLSDLSPLQGLRLTRLDISRSQVSDLSPLRGMPLTRLGCGSARVSDISPLADCKSLTFLGLTSTKVTAAQVAALQKALPNCKIEWDDPAKTTPQPASSSKLFMNDPAFPQWMAQVQAMPAEEQIKAVSKKLVELNPGFDGVLAGSKGRGTPTIENGVVTVLSFKPHQITDISPVRALEGLKDFECNGGNGVRSILTDLSPLQGMPLTRLNCSSLDVTNFSLLKDCGGLELLIALKTKITPETVAALQKALPNCKIEWDDPAKAKTPQPAASSKLFMHDPAFPQWMKDVQAMSADKQIETVTKKLMELNPGFDGKLMGANGRGSPTIENGVVTKVHCFADKMTDISPIRALRTLSLLRCFGDKSQGKLADLSPLQGLPLKKLECNNTLVEDLTPLHELPLIELDVRSTKVTAAGVAALQISLPNCKIDWDDPAKK